MTQSRKLRADGSVRVYRKRCSCTAKCNRLTVSLDDGLVCFKIKPRGSKALPLTLDVADAAVLARELTGAIADYYEARDGAEWDFMAIVDVLQRRRKAAASA